MGDTAPRRVHIAQATDWKEAVISLLEPRAPYRPWRLAATTADEGDLLAFVLNTDPASILTEVAVVGEDGVLSHATFHPALFLPTLMELATLASTVDLAIPIVDTWEFDGEDAASLCAVLNECRFMCHPASRFGRTSLAEARALLRFSGRCHGCDEDVDLTGGDATDAITVHTVDPSVLPRPAGQGSSVDADDWPAVLCRSCRKAMTDNGITNFLDFKFGPNPSCPECGGTRTRQLFYGMPFDIENIPPWLHPGGCCRKAEKWSCGICEHWW